MFDNLVCVFVGDNEFLAYNHHVAGIFNDFRATANAAIHTAQCRKLNEEEIEKLLDYISKLSEDIEIEEREPTEDEKKLIERVQVFYPEVRYIVQAIEAKYEEYEALAAKPQSGERRRKKKQRQKFKKEKERREREGQEPEPEPEPEPAPEPEPEPEDAHKPSTKIDFSDEKKEEPKKEGPSEFDEAERARKEAVEKSEKELSEPGTGRKLGQKGAEKYGGAKGTMFDVLKYIIDGDPEMKKDEKKLEEFIKKNYKLMKENEKWLEENEGFLDELREASESGEITPDTIAIMNEMISKDPEIIKEMELDSSKDPTLVLPIEFFKEFVSDFDESSEDTLNQFKDNLKDVLKDVDIDDLEMVLDPDIEKKGDREIVIQTDLDNVVKIMDQLGIKALDLRKGMYD